MTKGIKTLGIAILFACMALVNSTPAEAGTHPDGKATAYRGWGPTVPTQDGYICTLFDSFGVQVGSVQFHADGRIDATVGVEQAHFLTRPVGLSDVHALDTITFPDIPRQYRTDGYQIMTFSARLVAGVNMVVGSPTTSLAQSISVI